MKALKLVAVILFQYEQFAQ